MRQTATLTALAITASADAAAQIDITSKTTLVGIEWMVHTTTAAPSAGDYCRGQISLNSTLQDTNDANGHLANVGHGVALVTSGMAATFANGHSGPLAVTLEAGDRIYLNVKESGGASWNIHCVLHFK